MINRSRIYRHAMYASGMLVLVAVALLLFAELLAESGVINRLSLLLIIFLAGTIGGIANTHRRIARLSADSGAGAIEPSEIVIIFQIYMSCLFGGVFAIVAYALLLTGIIQGPLVPMFSGLDTPFTDVISFFTTIHPVSSIDAVKCLLWGFVAGFAEQWIPNMLDRLASQEKELERSAGK